MQDRKTEIDENLLQRTAGPTRCVTNGPDGRKFPAGDRGHLSLVAG
jgi:hypothetical protein